MAPLPSVKLSSSMTLKNNIELSLHNRICGVMVSVLASSAVAHRFEPRSGQTKDYKIGIFAACFVEKQYFYASPHKASTQHKRERAKTLVLFGIRIMCPSGTTCLSADCCFNELALCNSK